MRFRFYITIFVFLFLINTTICPLDKIDNLSFSDTPIEQVLKIISEVFEVSIIPDRDKLGNVTRYFKGTNIKETLTLLLEPLGLMYEETNGVYFVKRKPSFNVIYDDKTKLFNIESNNTRIQDVITKLSSVSKETIIFDGNKEEKLTLNSYNKNMGDLLNSICLALKYKIKKENNAYVIFREENEFIDSNDKLKKIIINGEENSISLNVSNISSNDLVLALFRKYNKELSLLSKSSNIIPLLDFKNVKFEDLLTIIFDFAGLAYTKVNDKYFVYDSINKQGSKYLTSKNYILRNLSTRNFISLIPSQIIPQSSYRIDNENNIVTFIGSASEVDYYLNYIEKVDLGLSDYKNRLIKLKYIDIKNIKKYFPSKYQSLNITIIEEDNSFYAFLNEQDYKDLSEILNAVDKMNDTYKYKFKYLSPDDVVKSLLPDYINKNSIIISKNESALYFKTTEELKDKLFKYFENVDVAPPVIRYQLLVVEYINKNAFKFNWGAGFKNTGLKNFVPSFGVFEKTPNGTQSSLISANFDIPTIFGFSFSVFLEEMLTEDKAKIQMSTEIYGISGEPVSLTNTQTLQYKGEKLNATGGKETTFGATTFGFNLEIKGRSTYNEEVFIEVNARISDNLGKKVEGEPPDTSEKSIKNLVRTKTGKPIILGGLVNNKETFNNNIIPGLGNIPYIGNLFKTHDNSYSNSEFVIYIIPFVQKSNDDIKKEKEELIQKIYESCM